MVAERTAAASELSKTTEPHGISGQEIKRFDGVVHFMKKHCTGGRQLWWVSVAHGSSREFIDKVWKRITNLQRDNRLPPYRAMTLEARGGLHAHIAFVGNRNIADRLKGSAALGGAINVGNVYNSAIALATPSLAARCCEFHDLPFRGRCSTAALADGARPKGAPCADLRKPSDGRVELALPAAKKRRRPALTKCWAVARSMPGLREHHSTWTTLSNVWSHLVGSPWARAPSRSSVIYRSEGHPSDSLPSATYVMALTVCPPTSYISSHVGR